MFEFFFCSISWQQHIYKFHSFLIKISTFCNNKKNTLKVDSDIVVVVVFQHKSEKNNNNQFFSTTVKINGSFW